MTMKRMMAIVAVAMLAAIGQAQYVQVGVNTNVSPPGFWPPVFSQFVNQVQSGFTNYVHVPSASNWLTQSGRTLTGCVTNSGSGTGGGSAWAQYPATTNADLAGYGITNVGGITTTGRLVLGIGVFGNKLDIPAPATSNVLYLYAVRDSKGTNRLVGVSISPGKTNRVWYSFGVSDP